jgi:formiminotetrahydrofolate cyclodeaminase
VDGHYLMDENVNAFLRVLDPSDNSTGGGTASAIAGAMSGALVAMVARLSVGKTDMEPKPFYNDIVAEAEKLSAELFDGGRADAGAFDAIRAAFKLPKDTPEDKAARTRAIQEATIGAARVPLANAERCRRVLELYARLIGHSNPNAASDLQCAGYLARAGLLGCVANVEINVPSIKDTAVRAELAQRAQALRTWLDKSAAT